MNTISDLQLENLLETMIEKKVKVEWIKTLCDVNNLKHLTVKQYNFLLLLIKGEWA